jgi:hypothetical protein
LPHRRPRCHPQTSVRCCPREAEPIEKPERRPLSTVTKSILLKASMTTIIRRGERGSPCLSPLELLKKPADELLTKTEKHTEETQCDILETHFSPKLHLFNMYNKNFQLMWSKAFVIPSLQSTPGIPDLIRLSKYSLAMRTKSKICLS